MKTTNRTAKVLTVAIILASCGITFSADRTWTGAESDEWNNSANWKDSNMPGIADTAVFTANAVVDNTANSTVLAGIRLNQADTNDVQISGGSITLGSAEYPVTLYILDTIRNYATNSLVFNNTNLKVGENTLPLRGGIGIAHEGGTMNVANSTLAITNGSFEAYVNRLYVAAKTFESNGSLRGKLIVSEPNKPVVVSVNNMYIGKGRTNAAYGNTDGLIDFTAAPNGTLNVCSNLYVGTGYTSKGILSFGENWDINIGSKPDVRAYIAIGNPISRVGANGKVTIKGGKIDLFCDAIDIGSGRAGGGTGTLEYEDYKDSSITIDATTMSVGCNRAIGNWTEIFGYFYAESSKNTTLKIETLNVSYYADNIASRTSYGEAFFGKGKGTIANLNVGRQLGSGASERGLLRTYGMAMNVTNSFLLQRSGAVENYVGNSSSGLHFGNDIAITINSTATTNNSSGITVIFDADPAQCRYVASPDNADAVFWGFKWDGDKTDDIATLQSARHFGWKFNGMSEFYSDKVQVFFDPGLGTEERPFNTTYLGFYIKQAHPATFIAIR